MTEEQRADLEIEWQLTSTKVKQMALYAYSISPGPKDEPEYFEEHFVSF